MNMKLQYQLIGSSKKFTHVQREKGRNLNYSYDKNPNIKRNVKQVK